VPRKRISLTARLGDKSEDGVKRTEPARPAAKQPAQPQAEFKNNPFARLRR